MATGGTGPVLPWMRVPITIEAGSGVPIGDVLGLDPRLASELLKGSGFHELFPVQAAVWLHSGGGISTAHDLCVAAPTGSGKTLSYALPVVNALAVLQGSSSYGRLQALVVLPTRDLAAQVYDVFRPLCDAVRLRTVLAAARSSEAAEAAQLVGAAGGCGGADVVVATPGRLMAHLGGTPGFTMRHLRFLVVDETDRLLRQSYQEWLPRVLAQLAPAAHNHHHHQHRAGGGVEGPDGGEGDHFAARWPAASVGTALPFAYPRAVKIVVSATLTRDPAKLQRLALHHPRYIATAASAGTGAGGAARYSLPRSLSEYRLLCSAARKPLALLALLAEAAGQSTIVFTSSLDMTHKLFLMLSAVAGLPEQVVEYSSLVPARERSASLERFRSGSAKVLVASDAMTRGMDVDCVQNVINYDAPVYAKTYVHRAGRTARAGKAGRVITLLRDEDMRHFKVMIRKADNNFVQEYKLPPETVEGFRPALAGALQQLEALLAAERLADKEAQQGQQANRPVKAEGSRQQGQQGQRSRKADLGEGAGTRPQQQGGQLERGGQGRGVGHEAGQPVSSSEQRGGEDVLLPQAQEAPAERGPGSGRLPQGEGVRTAQRQQRRKTAEQEGVEGGREVAAPVRKQGGAGEWGQEVAGGGVKQRQGLSEGPSGLAGGGGSGRGGAKRRKT